MKLILTFSTIKEWMERRTMPCKKAYVIVAHTNTGYEGHEHVETIVGVCNTREAAEKVLHHNEQLFRMGDSDWYYGTVKTCNGEVKTKYSIQEYNYVVG